MAAEFVHLHVHTQFSFLVSTVKLDALVGHVQKLGMRAVVWGEKRNPSGNSTRVAYGSP